MYTIGTKIDEVRIDGNLEMLRADLNQIDQYGIRAVELPAHGLDIIYNGKLNNSKFGEVIDILTDFDFTYSVHSPNPLNLMDTKELKLHEEVLLATLEFARQTRAKVVVYHAGRYLPEEKFHLSTVEVSSIQKENLLEKEAEVLQTAARLYPDILIAIENARPYLTINQYTYGESIAELKKQILNINCNNVRINLDFGHIHMTSRFYDYDLLDAVESIKNLIVHTHIHDNFGGAVHHWEKQQTHQLPFGRGDSHMPVGWGTIPIKDILEIILPNYKGLLMMELRSRYFGNIVESKNNLESIVNSIVAMKSEILCN